MSTRFVPLSSIDRLAANLFSPGPSARLDRQIPVDAYQRDGGLTLHFDLPGVSEDDVELAVERRVLTVRASRRYEPGESDQVLVAERPWGAMSRQIVLGDSLDTGRVAAQYDNGVLTVSVPLAANAQSRKIEITHAPVETQAAVAQDSVPTGERQPAAFTAN
jgi:HSP20 family protein